MSLRLPRSLAVSPHRQGLDAYSGRCLCSRITLNKPRLSAFLPAISCSQLTLSPLSLSSGWFSNAVPTWQTFCLSFPRGAGIVQRKNRFTGSEAPQAGQEYERRSQGVKQGRLWAEVMPRKGDRLKEQAGGGLAGGVPRVPAPPQSTRLGRAYPGRTPSDPRMERGSLSCSDILVTIIASVIPKWSSDRLLPRMSRKAPRICPSSGSGSLLMTCNGEAGNGHTVALYLHQTP